MTPAPLWMTSKKLSLNNFQIGSRNPCQLNDPTDAETRGWGDAASSFSPRLRVAPSPSLVNNKNDLLEQTGSIKGKNISPLPENP